MKATYTMDGVGGKLEVFDDKVCITPQGIMGFLNKGLKGTKTIPYHSISGIQFKASGLTNGYIQFTIPGSNESQGGLFAAASDENTFMFSGQNDLASKIKSHIEHKVMELRRPQRATPPSSVADELQKLATLKAQGILSDEEFLAAKQRLIG